MLKNNRFYNIISSSKPVLVDFYADWCVPCKELPPILNKLKDELKEDIRIIKVNVENNPFIATKYKIRSIPTLIIFKNSIPQWKGTGVYGFDELKSVVQRHI